MLTAAGVIDKALQNARAINMDAQALDFLNAILSDLCQNKDLALARGRYLFNFNPALVTLFGSGPYPLPLDYLRTSGSSGSRGVNKSVWYLYPTPSFPAGQPLYLIPIDLAEFDLFPQLPSQSTPELWATDMGGPLTQRIVNATTATLTAGSTAGTVADASNLQNGLSMAGEGVQPGTTITVSGLNITLSVPATGTNTAASVFFGIPPVAYVYPAPIGSYPVTVRYQRQMPDIVSTAQYPWFPSDGYLIDQLTGFIMGLTGDQRREQFFASASRHLEQYLGLSDDKTNRAQQVVLDARNFGRGAGGRLKDTKIQGWGC